MIWFANLEVELDPCDSTKSEAKNLFRIISFMLKYLLFETYLQWICNIQIKDPALLDNNRKANWSGSNKKTFLCNILKHLFVVN